MPLTPTGNGTIQVPENQVVDNSAIMAMNTTPAIQQLRDAFSKGLVTAEQMQQLFSNANNEKKQMQLNNEEIQASKARQSLIPAQTDLTANKIGVENSLIQPRAQAELGDIAIKTAGQPGAQATTSFASTEGVNDPTGEHENIRKNFEALHLGNILRMPDGTPDYEAMGAANERFAQFRMGNVITEAQKEIVKQMEDKSPEDQAKMYDPQTGFLKPAAQLKDILANSKPKLNAAEQQSATSAVIGADAGLANINRARGILKADPGAVGPGFKQGSAPGQLIAKFGAMAGNEASTKRFDNQKQLNTTLAQGILEAIRSLRGTGQIRNTEIAAIERGQPQPDSSLNQWNTWLNESEGLLQRAQRAQKLGLGVQTRTAIDTGTPPAIHDEPPAGPIEPKSGAVQFPEVKTQADYDAIPVGSSYVFDGKVYPKVAK